MKKTIVFASVAASALAFATLSYAATDTDPNAPAEVTQAASKIGMADALEAAKAKYPDAEALSATLHGTRSYGLVWDVRMEGKDGTAARVFVNPEDGTVLASNDIGIRNSARFERGPGYGPGYGPRGGYGPGYGPGCMGMNPDCPYYDEGRPRHHGGWWHGRRHGGGCWF